MKWYRGPEGDQRIWYEEEEIERITGDELTRAGLTPTVSAPVTDLERFIEGYLNADLDQYADLPSGVLGLTQFMPGRPPAISINAELTNSAEAPQARMGRWRATLAHEAAHVILHRYLFEPELTEPLFDVGEQQQPQGSGLMRCLNRDVGPVTRTRDWREVQANRGMAALLMPRGLFRRLTFQRIAAGTFTDLVVGSPSAELLAAQLADLLDVSKQAAAIRLETQGIVRPSTDSRSPALSGL